MEIELPQKVALTAGGQTDKMVLREPELRHVLVSEKETKISLSAHTLRARDIKLLSLVSGIDEKAIRELPVSISAKATAFLRDFVDRSGLDDGNQKKACDIDSEDLFIEITPSINGPDGQEYSALVLEEPTTGAVESAERALRNGINAFSLREYQQILIAKSSDMPVSMVPHLPISVVNRGSRILSVFIKAGPVTGEN